MSAHRWLNLLLAGVLVLPSIACASNSGCVTDWIDFVRYNGTSYINPHLFLSEENRPQVGREILGSFVAQTKRELATIEGCDITQQDGDAAFLDVGTSLYSVKGFDPRYLLMTVEEVPTSAMMPPEYRLRMFEANHREKAKVGRDLFDLAGKIVSVRRMSSPEPTAYEMAHIEDPAALRALASAIEDAPIHYEPRPDQDADRSILVITLDGGIVVRHAYVEASGYFGQGVILPEAAREILHEHE